MIIPYFQARAPLTTKNIVTVMTYNICCGAGVDILPSWVKEASVQQGHPGNRLPQVLEMIRIVDPDILGIQEAYFWDLGDPSVAQNVSNQLGMNYCISGSIPENGSANVVLFTKYNITEVESYSAQLSRAGLRAKLVMPNGQEIQVFVVHFHSENSTARMSELSFIVKELQFHFDNTTILMGDLNFNDYASTSESNLLRESGLSHPFASYQNIDQIWVSPFLSNYVRIGEYTFPSGLDSKASDHSPVTLKIGIP